MIPLNAPDHSRSDDATFVEGVFVESDDRTIQSLDVYVNAAAEKDLEVCKALARQILLSVAPGKKKLQLAAGERRLFAFSKDLEIAVMVPKNTVATKQVGPDFLVHRLIAVGRLGADSGSIGIYVGNNPTFKPGKKKSEGVMFGKKVEWHSFTEGQGVEALCELSIPGDPHLIAHVWVVGLKEAKDAVEAIQRGERPQDQAASDNSFHQTLVSLLKQGRKIDAIKVFREVTGSGLKESKAVIDSIAARHGLSGSQRTGCLGVIVLAVVILLSGFALR